ncbi:MAG: tetratricopeptide repeat protein [Edaphobacter sp.]|nr:tetratricopeptide repeat protein [Edaphobacter sp.]MDE1177634.1 tetratricopeptide repeat protein [Edaphobacter sp.]
MDRIALLSQVLEQNPTDAFARYGLAMAYVAEGKPEEALNQFTTLTAHNPDYVPAYQMSAQTLAKLGRSDEAIERLKSGLEAAARTGNQHAASEMQGMLDELGG